MVGVGCGLLVGDVRWLSGWCVVFVVCCGFLVVVMRRVLFVV